MRQRYIGAFVALMTSGATVPAYAQTAPVPVTGVPAAPQTIQQTPVDPAAATPSAASSPEEGGLTEIVVTAQRRAESLQRVPIVVSAITSEGLAKAGIQSTADLANVTPGLQLPVSRTTVTPYLRGVGTQNSGSGEEGSIATYVDGVYYSVLAGTTLAFNNIERVEVLKGPQGTLFGRNATGGLIHVITRAPSHSPMVDLIVGYANYDTVSGSAYATGGLTDSIAMDLAFYGSRQGDGYGKNVSGVAGVTGADVNYNREYAVRSKLLFEPSEALQFTLAGDYSHRNSDLGLSRQPLFGPVATCRDALCDNPAVRALITTTGGQTILSIPNTVVALGRTFVGGRYDTASGLPRGITFEDYGTSLKSVLSLGGDATLTSTTAYRHSSNDQLFDQDGGPTKLADTHIREVTRTIQQEFLLVGDVSQLNYTLGLFYFDSKAQYDPLAVASIVPAQNLARFVDIGTKSYAGFAQGTYALTATTHVTAGLRYTIDDRSVSGVDYAAAGNTRPIGTILNSRDQSKSFKKLTFRAAADQRITDTIFAFASYSRGYKSGVFNGVSYADPAARPETLDSYEAGFKTEFLDRRLRVNVSAFHYNYSDIQLLTVPAPGVNRILNASRAKVNGGDLEIVAAPPVPEGSLRLTANLSYLHGRYGTFVNMPVLVPRLNLTTGAPIGGDTQLAITTQGQTLIRTPSVTVNLGMDYSHDLGAGKIGGTVNYYYNSGFYWDPDNRIRQGSYGLLNAQLSYTSNSWWRISVFGRNLTDKFYYNQVSPSAGIGDQYSPGAPRTYGISFGAKFRS